jgi:hypothetical protein
MEGQAAPEPPNEEGFADLTNRLDEARCQASPVLLGDDSWDLVLLVEYPTRRAFVEMIQSQGYQAIAHLRTEALTKGELHPLDSTL